ncbi:MAG TPA: hypothetical protein VNL98_04525 [Gemmatimonadales bacterium]|nr:hypothetical protein [Gemmatimonadales bacterium]
MIAALLLALAAPQGVLAQDSFPHLAHRRLFTNCVSCHEGILTGDTATSRPAPSLCAECHDGQLSRRVNWQPAPARLSNLRLDHRRHAARVQARGDSALGCNRCHAVNDGLPLMQVGRASAERCITCHAHRAETHLASADCASCHRSLRDAFWLTQFDISRFPRPGSHDSGYVFRHGAEAGSQSCAVCHARESCSSCHVNARSLEPIMRLAADPRVAALMRERRVRYPEPASHRGGDFIRRHGLVATTSAASCANCHARQSCLNCHREEDRVRVVAQLPARRRGDAPGVDLSGRQPPDHVPGFSVRHAVAAAGGDAACSRCHTSSRCASCHEAASRPGFHPANFAVRHREAAFTADGECASCHQTQLFCRDCHARTGSGTNGPGLGRYHDGRPGWLFGHGGAARRSIETCAACHQQEDCLQCHSASRGWRVNPHGREPDPDLGRRNGAMCRTCHVGGPPRR